MIDNDDTETVRGDGTGTQASPWNIGDGLVVGNTGTGSLVITDGGAVSSLEVQMGGNAGSEGTVTVDGANSNLAITGTLTVGNAGAGNLTITGGGEVSNNFAFVGSGRDAVGTVTVDGEGSAWANSGDLAIGYNGNGSLTISDGATVSSRNGYVARVSNGFGSVTIDGAGSSWTNSQNLYVGVFNSGTMAITNGGFASSTIGIIGYGADSDGDVVIDGAGSAWENTGEVIVGRVGTGGLTLANGGRVSAGSVVVAQQAGSVGTVNIGAAAGVAATGAGLIEAPVVAFGQGNGRLVFNHTDTGYVFAPSVTGAGALDHYAGQTIFAGQSDYSGSTTLHGGTLVVGDGGAIYGTYEIVIAADPGDEATLVVRDGSEVYLNGDLNSVDDAGYLYVGARGSGGLTISDGGTVSDLFGYLGAGVGSDGSVSVDGVGSSWTNRANLFVGWRGDGNLSITNGGRVSNGFDTVIGSDALGEVSVDGAGSLLESGGVLFVGDFEAATLAITRGGSVTAAAGVIGAGSEALGEVRVDGSGSNLTIADPLYIGFEGEGSLAIADGGTVNSLFGYVGWESGSDGLVTVDGSGSAWNIGDNVFVAQRGDASLAITNGGTVRNDAAYVANENGSTASITVDGAGSTWTNEVGFVLGNRGTADLTVINGGNLATGYTVIGNSVGGVGSLSVDGAASQWTVSDELFIGAAGTGTLTLSNGGTLTASSLVLAELAGANGTVSVGGAVGELAVGPGVLEVPTLAFGAGTGTLVLNHTATDYIFQPALSGEGLVRHLAGYTRFLADSSGFGGAVELVGGTLDMAGAIGGTMSVSGSGRLMGTGTTGTLSIGSGGVVAPGNSIGTLNVTGNLTFAAGSVFEVEVDPSGTSSDLISVTGSATLQGGTVAHVGPDGDFNPSTAYTILTATGGVTGQFDGATSDFAFLFPVLEYLPNAVTLTLRRNEIAFTDIAQTYNQQQVAGAVEDLGFGNPVAESILLLGEDDARMAFDLLSGEVHASVQTALADDVRLIRQTVLEHAIHSDNAASVWAEMIGSWSSFDKAKDTASVDKDLVGVVGGAQLALTNGFVVGIATAYTDSKVKLDERLSSADLHSFHLTGYVGLGAGDTRMRAGAGYTHSTVNTSRQPSFRDFDEQLTAGYDGKTIHAFVEVGHELRAAGASIEPFARFAFARLDMDRFEETGGVAALSGASRKVTSAESITGVNFATSPEEFLRFEGTIGWQHVFSGYRSSAGLAFDSGPIFEIVGAQGSRDAGVLDLSAIFGVSGSAEIGVHYRGLIANGSDSHALSAAVSFQL
ncbi:autotransporter domain-containing protein [Qipengyuania gaetbuli]|uniref:autotransporter outer membrane beta-barrel domain-containing protein n=1 Tax=Qipengyuania gaetbuli TaxID=266952 RepID=UPI001CD2FED4|nr:autotransporter domain-containing protein [Qipengyuania gaetbuli]MCA0910602.1 autotransporter domain-containing protein [Qipengyuania gaetbuli]